MERLLSDEFIAKYEGKQPNWGFNGMGYVVYKRTYARPVEGTDRKEEWWETVRRCVEGAQEIGAGYTVEEAERIYDYVFNLKGSFSGRALWQLGTPLVKKFSAGSLVNCSYTNLENIDDFNFLFDMLMLGSGVGYSVERSKVHEFPKVKSGVVIRHDRSNDADIIVPDSREGWSRLLHSVLKSYFYTGKSFSYSTILVRGYGAALKTFGGTASGPEALIEGIEDICNILNARAGKKLRSVDVLDIANIIGRIVVSGSSRRSAQIAIGDPDDFLFLRAKNWNKGNIPDWRANSNNSIYADGIDEVIDELWKGYDGSGEPYGLINRRLATTQGRLGEFKDDDVDGPNPCAEILLKNKEVCNLAEIFLPNLESEEEMHDLSKLLYKTQKAITLMDYPGEGTNKIVHKNMRLGQSVTGWMQATTDQLSWVSGTYEVLRDFDVEWSRVLGVNPSVKLTAVKPSGTLSLLAGVTPGIHPAYARFYVRRVRMGSTDPLIEYCRSRGFKTEFQVGFDGAVDRKVVIVEFPCESPANALLERETNAVEQLEWVKKAQTEWADNAVSVTVYFKATELPEIKEWLRKEYDSSVKSVSFLLHSDHGFKQAPYEAISEAEYKRQVSHLKPIDIMTSSDAVDDVMDMDCATGACPIR